MHQQNNNEHCKNNNDNIWVKPGAHKLEHILVSLA